MLSSPEEHFATEKRVILRAYRLGLADAENATIRDTEDIITTANSSESLLKLTK